MIKRDNREKIGAASDWPISTKVESMIKPSEENNDPIMINKNRILNIGHVLSHSVMKGK